MYMKESWWNDMSDEIIELKIKNFPKQQAIFDHPARNKVAVKGRRFGLTKGAANDYIRCALKGEFKQGFWGDTINANIDRYVQRYFIPELKKLPKDMWKWKVQARTLHIKDSYIDFRSADNPQNWEGFGYDKYFLNEAGIILKDEYLWYNAVVPMLMEFKARGVIGGTPKGKGLFHTLAGRALNPKEEDWAYFHYTSYDNPYIPKEEVDKMAAGMTDMARKQEVYAEFLDDGGEVFRGLSGVLGAEPVKPSVGDMYVIGVDLAKVQDYTVLAVYNRHTNEQVYLQRFNKIEWPFQKKKIIATARYYNNALVVLDATGLGDPIADDLIRAGIAVEPIKLSEITKKEIIEKLVIWIEQRKIKIIGDEHTINEFENFSYEIGATGKIRYNARQGYHDDIVIAHALAVWSLRPLSKQVKEESLTIVQKKYRQVTSGADDYDDYYEYL